MKSEISTFYSQYVHACNQCEHKNESIRLLKQEVIRLQDQLQKQREKCSQLVHQKEYISQKSTYENWRQNFMTSEWSKACSSKENLTEIEKSKKKILQQTNKFKIQGYIEKIKQMKKQYDDQIERIKLQKEQLINIVKELNEKLNEKKKVCKVIMAKIHSLQLQNSHQKCLLQTNLTAGKRQEKQVGDAYAQVDMNEDLNQLIYCKIRDQLISEFQEIFGKSFDPIRSQPSLEIFKSNLQLINKSKILPYCQCFCELLKTYKDNPFTNLNKRQKWIAESFQCLKLDKKIKQNENLVYLFRISSLFYRIQNSIQGNEWIVREQMMNRIKNELFNAYYSYLFKRK